MSEAKTYQQASEPSDLTPGTTWLHDNGKAYIRKLDLTWNYVGEWELPNFHHLHLEGGSMLGPIGGAHGLCHSHNPAFTGTATLNDVDLADKQWISTQLEDLRSVLENYISGKMGGTSGNVTVGNNMAIGFGTVQDGATIPLPTYADNTRASKSEVWGVLPSIKSMVGSNHPYVAFQYNMTCSVDANLVASSKWSGGGYVHEAGQSQINYIIICKR